MSSIPNLGAWICIRNCRELDYCWELAAESLLKIVDELVICDSDSTDGTRELADRMARRDPRIRVVNYPWPKPFGESHFWFIKWLEFAKSNLKSSHYIYLDADEVLSDSEECHQAIREAVEQKKCLAMDRFNFWRDPQHVTPDGAVCGKWCIRCAPMDYEVVSDEPHHAGERRVVDDAIKEQRAQIFHLGFLREKKAWYRKSKVILEAWFARWDERQELGQKKDQQLWENEAGDEFKDRLEPVSVNFPKPVQLWLAERGHQVSDFLPAIIEPEFVPKKVEVVPW